jgi:3',5'-cyclic AMP phosphodiesterase CpdA
MTQQHRTSDPADTLRILHLSDPHLTASGFDEDGVDAARALGILMETLDDVDDVDLVITTGDIADDGSVEGCRRVRDVIGAFARQRGVPHVYTTGNHDRRASFVEVFGSGHLAADGTDVASVSGPAGICAAVSHVRGLRVVTVDSLVPGSGHGFVGEEQLGWLREVLATPAPRGTTWPCTTHPSPSPGIPCPASCCAIPVRSRTRWPAVMCVRCCAGISTMRCPGRSEPSRCTSGLESSPASTSPPRRDT